MKILITGGAGFIGSHLVEFLLLEHHDITVFDDLSTGRLERLASCIDKITMVQGDVRDSDIVDSVIRDQDLVFHFCDNSDIQYATSHPKTYVEQNIVGSFNVLESMRRCGVKRIVFPSSTTVFGNAVVSPTPETYGPLHPMTLYGGAKLACEGLISAYAHSFDITAWIFRFANIIGGRMDHGSIFDFIRKLRENPNLLHILGDGSQERSYLLVDDCVEAIWTAVNALSDRVNTIHLGNRDRIRVRRLAELVCQEMELENVEFTYSGGTSGWIGDARSNYMQTETLDRLGWTPRLATEKAVRETVRRLTGRTNYPGYVRR